MIHDIGIELGQQLLLRGFPFPVIDGPEKRETATYGRERVVIDHDPNGDSFGSPQQRGTPPVNIMNRLIGVRIEIFAKRPGAGATYYEHKDRAEQMLDMVLCALYKVAKIRQNPLSIRSGKFVEPPDLKESETPGGAKYELLFSFGRGVADRNWDNSLDPTAVLAVVNTTLASGET